MTTERPQACLTQYAAALDSGDPRLRLQAHALRAALGLVPASFACFMAVSRRLEVTSAIGLRTDGRDASMATEWERYLSEGVALDPFAPGRPAAADGDVLTLSGLPPDAAPEFRRYLADAGMCDRATLYLRHSGTVVALIALLRSEDEPVFSESEVLALRRLRPLLEHAHGCGRDRPSGRRGLLCERGLTDREADVAELVAEGVTNAEIGKALFVSRATVKTHLSRVYAKTGVRNRTQLAVLLGSEPGR